MFNSQLALQWVQYANSRRTLIKRQRDRGCDVPPCLDMDMKAFRTLYHSKARLPPILESLTFVVPKRLPTGMMERWQPPLLPPFSETVLMLSKQGEDFDLDSCTENAPGAPTTAINSEGKISLFPRLLLNLNGNPYQCLYGNETLFLYVEQKSCIGRDLAKQIISYCQFVRATSLVLTVNNLRTDEARDMNPLTSFASDVFEGMQQQGFGFELCTFARTTFDPTHTEGFSRHTRLTGPALAKFYKDNPGKTAQTLQIEPSDDPVQLHFGFQPGDVLRIDNPDDGSVDYCVVSA